MAAPKANQRYVPNKNAMPSPPMSSHDSGTVTPPANFRVTTTRGPGGISEPIGVPTRALYGSRGAPTRLSGTVRTTPAATPMPVRQAPAPAAKATPPGQTRRASVGAPKKTPPGQTRRATITPVTKPPKLRSRSVSPTLRYPV